MIQDKITTTEGGKLHLTHKKFYFRKMKCELMIYPLPS